MKITLKSFNHVASATIAKTISSNLLLRTVFQKLASFSAILILPLIMTGCMTLGVLEEGTCKGPFKQDDVKRIEKASLVNDTNLVVWVDVKPAHSMRQKQFTLTIPIQHIDSAENLDCNSISISPGEMTKGWRYPQQENVKIIDVPVAPILKLNSHQETVRRHNQPSTLEATDKAIYLVKHTAPCKDAELVYLSANQIPTELSFSLTELGSEAPPKYPLLLFVPMTVPVDAATLPLQLGLLALLMSTDLH